MNERCLGPSGRLSAWASGVCRQGYAWDFGMAEKVRESVTEQENRRVREGPRVSQVYKVADDSERGVFESR